MVDGEIRKNSGSATWRVLSQGTGTPWQIQTTETNDPGDLSQNVAVVLDQARMLTNGNPGTLAPWLDSLALSEGNSVFHLGCGSGYYSAILAEVVGSKGRVTAVESDPKLAATAREALSNYSNIELIEGDGGALDPGPTDAILVNAGVTHPRTTWLDCLNHGGTLVLPLTVDIGLPHIGKGLVLRVQKQETTYAARFLPLPIIYSCTSVRDSSASQLLGKAFMTGTMASVRTLRRDFHASGPDCWLHTATFCLSTAPPVQST